MQLKHAMITDYLRGIIANQVIDRLQIFSFKKIKQYRTQTDTYTIYWILVSMQSILINHNISRTQQPFPMIVSLFAYLTPHHTATPLPQSFLSNNISVERAHVRAASR